MVVSRLVVVVERLVLLCIWLSRGVRLDSVGCRFSVISIRFSRSS